MDADIFSALANPVRREILVSLRDGPRAVNDLASRFALSRPAVSEHLECCAGRIWFAKHPEVSGGFITWRLCPWPKWRHG